jgi:hypothetical protein
MKIAPTALVAAALTAGIAFAPLAQAAGTDTLFVPGTGSTKKGASDKVDAAWLDGGRWGKDPVYCICDSDQYPAALGPGVGQASADQGKESTVQFLLAHPEVKNVIAGSQGGGVAYEAVNDPRLAGRELNVVLYSDMDAPNGMRARAVGVNDIPFVGLRGGVPVTQNDPSKAVTDIGHEWDPVFRSPKYQASWVVTIPTGMVGFIVYHSALGGPYGAMQIDYAGAKVEKAADGRTIITIKDPLTPWGQLATILVTNVAGPKVGFAFQTLIKPVDDIAAGVLNAVGGYDEKGGATVGPTSAGEVQRMAQRFADGFTNAAKDFAAIPQKLSQGPKPKVTTPPSLPAAETPVAVETPVVEKAQVAKVTPQVKTTPRTKAPKPFGGPGNPVHDTIKTVQGAINNTVKTWSPKPKKASETKADQGGADNGGKHAKKAG